MRNVFLTGFMATGKTEIGRALAARLERDFIDTDAEVEREAGMSVAEIFATRGQETFRTLEREAISNACTRRGAVVATGGGAVLDPANRARMREAGVLVCLEATPRTILERVGSAASRPLLAGADDPLRRIEELLAERAAAYADSDLRVDTSKRTPREAVDAIARWIGR